MSKVHHGHHAAAPQPGPRVNVEPDGFAQTKYYDALIQRASERYGVDPSLIKGMMCKESHFNPNARSGAGARGLLQMMPATARGLGVKNPANPEQNVMAGTRYMSELLQKYNGDERLALAAYNAGPGNVSKYNGIPPFRETQQYVTKVLDFRERFRADFAPPATSAPAAAPVTGSAAAQPTQPSQPAFGDVLSSLSGFGVLGAFSPALAGLDMCRNWMFEGGQGQAGLQGAQSQASKLQSILIG